MKRVVDVDGCQSCTTTSDIMLVLGQKMRNEKAGKQDYKMVSVPGKQSSTLDGMSVVRLQQELEALRESEVCPLASLCACTLKHCEVPAFNLPFT